MELCSKPMMLKDYICHDTSSSDGFHDYPRRLPEYGTVRSLLELDRGSHGRHPKLIRSTSLKAASAAISKLQRASSFLLHAVKLFHGDNRYQKPSFLPRSLSRRLSKNRRTKKYEVDQKNISNQTSMTVKDIIRWSSFTDAPNKVVLSPSSELCSDRSSSTIWSSYSWSDSDFTVELGSTCSGDILAEEADGYYAGEEKEIKGPGEEDESVTSPAINYYKKSMEGDENKGRDEEKEQLSPVSVLDFPDDNSNSPSSSSSSCSSDDFRRLANVERAKNKFMQKIKRFESLAELEPVNLESRIAEPELDSPTNSGRSIGSIDDKKFNTHDHDQLGSEEDIHIYEAAELLMSHMFTDEEIVELTEVDRMLVLDFLHEGLEGGAANCMSAVEALAVEAEKWVSGGAGVADGNWGVEMWELYVKEVEGGRRWRTFEEERDEVVLALALAMMEELVLENVF